MKQYIENNGEPNNLFPVDIILYETRIPMKKIFMNTIVKIGIFWTGWVFMVLPMLIYEIFVRKKGIDKNNKSTNRIVNFPIGWKNSAVHGIMSRNEKSCIEKCLPEDSERNQQGMKLN